MKMIYSIAYEAVLKKAATNPPNELIGNTEMAAGIGIILKEIQTELESSDFNTPQDIKDKFIELIDGMNGSVLSDTSVIIYERIKKYKVKDMVNETMDDLKHLIKYDMN